LNAERGNAVSTFDHAGLIQEVTHNLAGLRKAQPEVMQAFGQLSRSALVDGAISEKHKELIALGISISVRCAGCIGFHVKALKRLGVTRAEFDEALGVAVYMGGGPSLMYTAMAISAYDEFSNPPPPAGSVGA
jgi:AhpD family alkylhydroperoxidase